MTYNIKLFLEEPFWVAQFVSVGGPDVVSQGIAPGTALMKLGAQLSREIQQAGGIDKIPTLPEDGIPNG